MMMIMIIFEMLKIISVGKVQSLIDLQEFAAQNNLENADGEDDDDN